MTVVQRVPASDLVDLVALERQLGRKPGPKAIREALPPGWLLDEDGVTAREDTRLFARGGWVLILALVSFGSIALGMFWHTFPRGWGGVLRFVVMIGVVLLAGGIAGPMITKALNRRS